MKVDWSDASYATTGRRFRIPVAAIVVVMIGLLCPLGGSAPQHCSYDGDVGLCSTLVYRSLATMGIARIAWGGQNTSSGHR